MARRPAKLEDGWGMVIYYEMLNYAEDFQAIPDPYAFFERVLIGKGYRFSRGAFRYWLSKLQDSGWIVRLETGEWIIKGISLTVHVDRERRDEFLAKQPSIKPFSPRINLRDNPILLRRLYRSQKGKCWWCGGDLFGVYHVDHRVPLCKHGTNSEDNLCLSCPQCNMDKNGKLPYEFNGRLI